MLTFLAAYLVHSIHRSIKRTQQLQPQQPRPLPVP